MAHEQPNLDYVHRLADGDTFLKKRLIAVMVSEFKADYDEYKNASAEFDFKKIITFVHRLKHKIGFLGMEYSYQIAHKYEEELHKNEGRLAPEFEHIMSQIKHFVNTLEE
ncbi:Hpt domain-containing protein [Flavobacterium sp.]|uniref:Hpt domain-containing protein n=1 Tax=Flavobacterium sp. TaxID=239 RepID=UPI0026064EA4|nr:Hpt domain-containing protein [Flavobacterium sp.]